MSIQQGISAELSAGKVGKRMKVIIDRREGDYYVGQMEDARLDEKTKNNSIRIPAILIRGVDIMPSLASFTRV